MTTLCIETERWPLAIPLRDGGGVLSELEIAVVTLRDGAHVGRGEAAGVHYHGEDARSMVEQIELVRARIERGLTRTELLELLPPGGARNAVDCALWDMEAAREQRPAWQLARLLPPRPLLTTYTIGADAPDLMAVQGRAFATARALKLKLLGEALDIERVRAVRAARPDAWLCVDANQSFTPDFFTAILPVLLDARVELIEQPFPAGEDELLDEVQCPIPIAADESVQDIRDLPRLRGRFACVNIKLDKCGGLTAALAMARQARAFDLEIMVGCMAGTTLAMSPAFLVGQLASIVDLDGPVLLREDRSPAAVYEHGTVWCPESAWGGVPVGHGVTTDNE
jgi:L-alanine-DL-glutamate epimerase-like enolase superfamily enzyme